MTDTPLVWATPTLHDLGPVSVAQAGPGIPGDGSDGSGISPP